MREKEIIVKYLLGNMTYEEFVNNMSDNMLEYLNKRYQIAYNSGIIPQKHYIIHDNFQKVYKWIMSIDSSFFKKAELYEVIYNLIEDEKIEYYSKYDDLYELSIEAIPDYLDGDEACNYIEAEIFSKIPNNLSESKKKKFIKEECKKVFQYQTKKPRWVQSCEWPVVNGRPLKFMFQKEDGDLVQFHFIDEDTEEEYIVEQYC